VLALPYFV